MGLLEGAISGLLLGGIAVLIACVRNNRTLKKCLITEENFAGPTFEYKGKRYDRQKYIYLRRRCLSSRTKRDLQKLLQQAQKDHEKNPEWVFYPMEIEAITQMLDEG